MQMWWTEFRELHAELLANNRGFHSARCTDGFWKQRVSRVCYPISGKGRLVVSGTGESKPGNSTSGRLDHARGVFVTGREGLLALNHITCKD